MLAQLVLNERSRRGAEAAPLVRETLKLCGMDSVESGPDDVVEGADCVIAAGGDGTLIGAIGQALARNLPLGIIPLGTFNELARTLEIPLEVAGAIRIIHEGHLRTIDVGRVNGAYFVNESSIGISSRISRLQTPELKQHFGFLGVAATALQAYRHSKPIHAEVLYDGGRVTLKTIQLTIANSHRFGGFLDVEGAAIDDGWLDLYSVDIQNFRDAFGIAHAMFRGIQREVPGLKTLRAKRFEVRTHHAHHITADAEPAGTTPAVFEILPQALRVYTPFSAPK